MRVRALDALGDWTFGKGQNDYKTGVLAIAQNIQTRLNSFVGDCFFSTTDWVDWFTLLTSKNQLALNLAVSGTIKNTEGVISIMQLFITLSSSRVLTIKYTVNTALGVVTSTTSFTPTDHLLTQGGEFLTTESGNPIIT